MSDYDFAIIGAGIAGAGILYALLRRDPSLKIIVLEAESIAGYHTTGRSAAFFAELYGGAGVQPLSTASRAFLAAPPADFSETAFLSARGALHVAPPGRADLRDTLVAEFTAHGIPYIITDQSEARRLIPGLLPQWADDAVYEPGCADIDVAGLHQAYLRWARRAGAHLCLDARVTALGRMRTGWRIATAAEEFSATSIINAAGAWADEVAVMSGMEPLGLEPRRRTMVAAEVDPPAKPDMPLLMDMGGSFYFRPDNYQLWLSPHDETPDRAHDVQPEELDIAVTLDRFEKICDWPVQRVVARWAGLRTFAPDRLPVLGREPLDPTFIWCAGQGGWGIQTAPAASDLLATLILEEGPVVVDAALYQPSRFR